MLVKDLEVQSGCAHADAGLAGTELVADNNGVGVTAPSNFEANREHFGGSGEELPPVVDPWIIDDGRLELIRRRFESFWLFGELVHFYSW